MTRALVTGASGLIGRWAVRDLHARGLEVHAVGTAAVRPTWVEAAASWHQVDLLDEDAAAATLRDVKPGILLHLAWETRHGHFWETEENDRWVASTVALARSFVAAGGQRLVVAGTCAEYDWEAAAQTAGVCHEGRTPCAPVTRYGRAKLRTLRIVEEIAAHSGMSFAWGRIFSVYGEGEQPNRLVPELIRSLLNGEVAHVRSPAVVRDYLHSEDAGRAFARLISSQVEGPVNIASGRGISLGDLAGAIAGAVGVGAREEGGAEGEHSRLIADVTRLASEVGFLPSVGLQDGLRRCVRYWRSQL